MDGGAWWAAVHGVTKSRTRLNDFTFTFHFHALEKKMATHSSVLAWRIPGTGAPGGLPSVGLHRVGHDWNDLAAAAAAFLWILFSSSVMSDLCNPMDCSMPGCFPILPCIHIPYFLYPCVYWWTLRLLPCLSCCAGQVLKSECWLKEADSDIWHDMTPVYFN